MTPGLPAPGEKEMSTAGKELPRRGRVPRKSEEPCNLQLDSVGVHLPWGRVQASVEVSLGPQTPKWLRTIALQTTWPGQDLFLYVIQLRMVFRIFHCWGRIMTHEDGMTLKF